MTDDAAARTVGALHRRPSREVPMSAITTPIPRVETPGLALPGAARGGRLGLVFAAILLTSVSAFVLSVVSFAKPLGDDDLPDYAALAPHRSYVWTFFAAAGVQLVIGATVAAIAAMVLAPNRWGTVGGSIVWIGAA